MKGVVGLVVAVVVLIAVFNGSRGGGGGGSSSSGDQAALASAAGGAAAANIYVVASKSFCHPTGIDDAYTGDGHVTFFVTVRNSGGVAGTAQVTPVRHYDDGETNESVIDTMSADVAARSTSKFRSEELVYKAHSHEVAACGLIVDGRAEVPIDVVP